MKILTLKKHNEDCCIKGKKGEYYLFERVFFGNAYGHEGKKSSWHRWMEFRCNDPDCEGRWLIDDFMISDTLKNALNK